MANPARGEFDIELNGKTYTLHVGINALVAVESLFSMPSQRVTWQDVARLAERESVTHIRGLIWAMTRKHHREMTVEDVGDLIDAAGLEAVEAKFQEAMLTMLPAESDLRALGIDPANPPQAQTGPTASNGTGTRSSRKRGKSG